MSVILGSAGLARAAEPLLWTRPTDDISALVDFTSYYGWETFSFASNPTFQPDAASHGPDGATAVASGNYIVTSSSNIYGQPSVMLNLPGYTAESGGYTTVFLQTGVVVGSAGTTTGFQLTAGGNTYSPQVGANGGVYFQVAGRHENMSLSFGVSVDHTSIENVFVDTLWSLTAPDLGSLNTGGDGLTVVPGGAYSSLGFGYSSPTKTSISTQGSWSFGSAINDSGTSMQNALLLVGGTSMGVRGVRFDSSGNILEMQILGTDAAGANGYADVSAINNSGQAVGRSSKFATNGTNLGIRAVTWDTQTGQITELGGVTANSGGAAYDINESGVIVGQSDRQAVVWHPGSLTPVDLGRGSAYAINDAGLIVGIADSRPARWEPGTTTPVYLGTAGLAFEVNPTGEITGFTGTSSTTTAARWVPGSTDAITLSKPASFNGGAGRNAGLAIDDAGNIVGFGTRYSGTGANLGSGAVLWRADETVGIALQTIGVDANGNAGQSFAQDINNAGFIVGSAAFFDESNVSLGFRAVVWSLADGSVIDLNTLIDPSSGWVLTQAQAITDTGWITGVGMFTSVDGSYERSFSIHISQFAVPAPGAMSLLVLAGGGAMRRRRR